MLTKQLPSGIGTCPCNGVSGRIATLVAVLPTVGVYLGDQTDQIRRIKF